MRIIKIITTTVPKISIKTLLRIFNTNIKLFFVLSQEINKLYVRKNYIHND